MRKIFSFLVAGLLCTSLAAQQLNEDFSGEGFPPEGWSVINSNQYANWRQSSKEGKTCAMVPGTYGYENWLITPELKPADGESLQFTARIGDYTSQGQLRVEVSLNGTEASSFELLETFYTSKTAGDDAHRIFKTDWREFTVNLSAYKGQRIYIAFHQYGEADKIYVTDVKGVSFAGSASCENPSKVTLSSLESETATFTWEGTAAEYQYLVVEKGEEVDWDEAVKTSEKTATVTDLYDNTEYEFYVRSYCSESEQSLAPKVSFKTPCEAFEVPWIETFSRDATGAISPECWTVASANPQVWVVADKTYDSEGNATLVAGQAHLSASGGGPSTEQVFALPTFNAPLNTLEVAFDYMTSLTTDGCGVLEVGYMTNPSKASTFVSLEMLPRTLSFTHKIVALNDVPESAKFIAFRFSGGTSDLCYTSLDNFVVAEIGKSDEVDPSQEILPDANIYALTYCEAQFTWFSYNAEAFAIAVFDAEAGKLVGGITVTTSECDRFAQDDGIGFSEYEDYENKYYCSTKWILNVEETGLQKGESWDKCVINVGTAVSPILALAEGKYQIQVYALVVNGDSYSLGESLATIPFELVSKHVTNLAAVVAEDKQTATLTWTEPELGNGERLYVSIRSGETVAFDNFDDRKIVATSPLTVDVEEGLSYTAYFQIIDRNVNPLGYEVQTQFTVGVNKYEPTNVHAEVFSGDNVTFSWDAENTADRYVITLFLNGEFYSTLTVSGNTKTTTMPTDGTWTWTVQAFNQGSNGNYFEASNAIDGNAFETKATDVPEDAVELTVVEFRAYYLDPACQYYQEGLNGWFLEFYTGDDGIAGYPVPYFLIYTAKPAAISGVYNVARNNIDIESCYMETSAQQYLLSTDAEIRLAFDGFDEDRYDQGYRYGYYTGSFRLVGEDGKTYVAKFMELLCSSFSYSSWDAGLLEHEGMWDEDPDVPQTVDNVLAGEGATKVIENGAMLILRDGKKYNVVGARVE